MNLMYSSEQFGSIIQSSAHLETVIFDDWILESSKCDFGEDIEYKIKTLSFQWCGVKEENSWSENQKRFKSIIRAISKCSLKDSLEVIGVYKCGLSKERIQELLSKRGLGHVEISMEIIEA